MHIMAQDGWRQLSPARFTKGSPGIWNYQGTELPYNGPFPSIACKRFIAKCEADHAEWTERRAALIADGKL